mgnify:FL=1
MQLTTDVRTATGNGKEVALERNLNTHTQQVTIVGSVAYSDHPHLNFEEKFNDQTSANRWFRTWAKLTEETNQ